MKRITLLLALAFIMTNCIKTKRTDEIFVGLWKCNSIVGTDENGNDHVFTDLLTMCDGTIKKIENTEEGYYFILCNNIYTIAKVNDTTLSGDGLTLSYSEHSQKLIVKNKDFIAITGKSIFWVQEFYKQK
jgi:hypothetical protein